MQETRVAQGFFDLARESRSVACCRDDATGDASEESNIGPVDSFPPVEFFCENFAAPA
jgi:hypothetical protein